MKFSFCIFFLAISAFCFGQQTRVTYYKDVALSLPSSAAKAKYAREIADTPGGVRAVRVLELQTKRVLSEEAYKGTEPVGHWLVEKDRRMIALDYDFNVRYDTSLCARNEPALYVRPQIAGLNPLANNDSLGYSAPQLHTGERTFAAFVLRNVVYPVRALAGEISGRVYVKLVLSESGVVSDIAVRKPGNVLLDKEAVRMIRSMKFSKPAAVNGINKPLCLFIPVDFRIE